MRESRKHSKGKGQSAGGGTADHDRRLSKKLTTLLRHTAVGRGLALQPDGFALLSEVLALRGT
jgi:RNA:NAD 2'-phosphotransferase (TPT1/KptA family)